ncbi:MAG: DUF4293 domain-containing protein [Flavobacteriales bacterium]|nr:DUF4293 domain-containing protein [Flavobacteriales bacterium]MBL6873354.1 DUF4293 domain-containing protein [Flavobacteriales bacterium]
MIQRVQSIYLFFAILFMLAITYFLAVTVDANNNVSFTYDSIYAHVTILISSFLLLYSIFQFKNRKKQLLLNQVSKLFLSATFFILFFTKGESMPQEGMFVFIIPYVLILIANRFIKKDEKLVESADRLR